MKNPTLHVFGQYGPHDDMWIKGNKEALTRLRDTLNNLLAQPGDGADAVGMWTHDGEGYNILILRSDDKDLWDQSGLPYTADWMQDTTNTASWPWVELDTKTLVAVREKAIRELKWEHE